MKLLKLIVNNFRQFYDKNVIVFSTDSEKNITLIHGENGLGKTTLLNAVLWCFYEKFTSDFENQHEVVNLHSLAKGNMNASVEIYFEHEGEQFYIKREYNNSDKKTNVTMYEVQSGAFHKQIKLALPFIESVIPSQMADYFFFHGEGIANITNSGNVTKFRKAIRDILGFTSAEFAKEDLCELISRRKNEVQKLTKKNYEYSNKLKIKTELEYDRSDKLKVRQNCIESIDNAQSEYDILSERLKNIKIFNVSEIQSSKLNAEKRKKKLELDEIAYIERQRKLIYKYGTTLFGYKLSNEAMLSINEKEILGEIPSPYDESLINKILDAKSCICGRAVHLGSPEFEQIKSLRSKSNTADIKIRRLAAIHYAGSIGNISDKPQEFISEFSEIDNNLAMLLREKQTISHEIESLQQQLDDIGDGGEQEVANINKEIREVLFKRDEAKIKLNNVEQSLSSLNTKIIECERWLSANTPSNDLVFKYNNEIQKISKLVTICDDKLKSYEATARNNIVNGVNLMLNNFSRKDFSVRVTDGFDFKLARRDGSLVAKSKGENLLLNLSFVSALLGFCAQRVTSDNRFLIRGTVAPFFIDAPFGELDDTYRQATAIFLPQCCEQLILLLSSSHWNGTVDQAIQEKVGKEYIIVSHKTEDQNSKPDDVIVINGNNYHQSKYRADFEGSVIEEV